MNSKLLIGMALGLSSNLAFAQEVEVWHGWMNLTPCSTVEWRNDGIFGTPSPTYIESPQELHGRIYADIPAVPEIIERVRDDVAYCGVEAAAVTTAVAILTQGAGGWEAFVPAFRQCISNKAEASRYVGSIRLATESHCN